MTDVDTTVFRSLRNTGYFAVIHSEWLHRRDFRYLGIIHSPDGRQIPWAWHENGRSIDKDDRGFDCPLLARRPYFWLGADAEYADD